MSEETGMESAVLTATISSLKLLKKIRERQEAIAGEQTKRTNEALTLQQEVKSVLEELKGGQTQNAEALQRILDLPKPQEFDEIKTTLAGIQDTVKAFNLDDLLASVGEKVTAGNEDVKSSIQSATDKLSAQADKNQKDVLSEVDESNKAENVETIKQLIAGLVNMQTNIMELAKRVSTLSGNVNGVRQDAKTLNGTIVENNSRIRSMDLRMALLANQNDTDELATSNEAVELLKSLPNGDNNEANNTDDTTSKGGNMVAELRALTQSVEDDANAPTGETSETTESATEPANESNSVKESDKTGDFNDQ